MTSRTLASDDHEQRPSTNYTDCPECQGKIVTIGGEVTCGDCGLIVTEYRLDHRGPRTYFGVGPDRERTGAPLTPTMHDRGLSTEIGRSVDGRGKPLTGAKRRQLGRLRREHTRARWRSKAERNLAQGFREIGRLVGTLALSRSIRDRACTLFRKAQAENLLLGRSIEAVAAGSVFAACRCGGVLRSVDEIVDATVVERTNVTNAYGVLNQELGLETQPLSPGAYVARTASDCGALDTVRERAGELVDVAETHGLANGRNPAGIAAACLYLAGRERGGLHTQGELANAAGVSKPTVRARYQELRDCLDESGRL